MEKTEALTALAALAQENRLDVFRLLVEAGPKGLPAGKVAEELRVAPNTLTFHFDRLRTAGLVDLYRARYPDEPGFSWWDYRAGSFHKNEGMRIDLLLATPAIANRVTDVYVDREFRKKGKPSGSVPSDHAPVVALLT